MSDHTGGLLTRMRSREGRFVPLARRVIEESRHEIDVRVCEFSCAFVTRVSYERV